MCSEALANVSQSEASILSQWPIRGQYWVRWHIGDSVTDELVETDVRHEADEGHESAECSQSENCSLMETRDWLTVFNIQESFSLSFLKQKYNPRIVSRIYFQRYNSIGTSAIRPQTKYFHLKYCLDTLGCVVRVFDWILLKQRNIYYFLRKDSISYLILISLFAQYQDLVTWPSPPGHLPGV